MFIQGRRKLMMVSVLAAMLASAGSAAIASASSYEDDDDGAMKRGACGIIGCANGNRVCGTAGGTIKAGAPPFVGEVNVTYTCYEALAS